MPDHIHLLVGLGENTELSGAIRLFKGRLSPTLRAAGLKWERGYYDHRIRADEDRLPIFLYIFLNPYRRNYLAAAQTWHGYTCAKEDWAWFGELTSSDCPYPEWLA